MGLKEQLEKVREDVWELPKSAKKGMRVPAKLFLSEKLLEDVEEGAIEQVANIAFLPGIYKHSLAMPDIHYGYGFPIGGVAALDIEEGGLSPGGIGFDINCGVRLLRTNLDESEVRPRLKNVIDSIFKNVPSGLGSKGKVRLGERELKDLLDNGASWTVDNGYGNDKDLDRLEEGGCLEGADSSKVSEKALKRGMPQVGSLGSGNHFLEIQRVNKILLPDVAKRFGIEREGQVMVMIHTGSRGLGHQICTDYLQILENKFKSELSKLPDRELVYAPAGTKECDDYYGAMACGANFAWANRQMIMHWIRESLYKTMNMSEGDAGIEVVYDVAHNIGKIEEHEIDGRKRKVYIHRKGSTRALGPGSLDLPSEYKSVGQPVLVPGSMGTSSYVLVGTDAARIETFSSVCHGAGRLKSRSRALKEYRGEEIQSKLGNRGIMVKAASWKGIAEEAPGVYKDVDEVVKVCETAGIAKIVAEVRPIGVIKG